MQVKHDAYGNAIPAAAGNSGGNWWTGAAAGMFDGEPSAGIVSVTIMMLVAGGLAGYLFGRRAGAASATREAPATVYPAVPARTAEVEVAKANAELRQKHDAEARETTTQHGYGTTRRR